MFINVVIFGNYNKICFVGLNFKSKIRFNLEKKEFISTLLRCALILFPQLPEEIEEIQAYVSGELDHHGDSTQFVDEPLYQIYHCGATVRDMQRQSNEGTVHSI